MIDVAAHGAQKPSSRIRSGVGEMHHIHISTKHNILICRCTYTTVIHMPDGDGGERVNINRGGLVGALCGNVTDLWLTESVCPLSILIGRRCVRRASRASGEASILVCSQSFSLCGNKRAFYRAIFLVWLNIYAFCFQLGREDEVSMRHICSLGVGCEA